MSAPGGDSRDTATGLANPNNRGLVLSRGGAVRGCTQTPACARSARSTRRHAGHAGGDPLDGQRPHVYWRYLQGTSMASPHAVGVAALIVAEYGKRDKRDGGLKLDPDKVERILAQDGDGHPVPEPAPVRLPRARER